MGGRMQEAALPTNHWNLGYRSAVTPTNVDANDDVSDDEESVVASEGSMSNSTTDKGGR
jgi:hypothetical protein